MGIVIHRTRAILCAILLVVAFGHAAAQQTKEIPWQGESFTGTLVGADIRNVLRRLLATNGGIQAIFKPGVEAEVTQKFENTPLQAVFNQLIEENELEYSFDSAANTVTIFPKKGPGAVVKSVREFMMPRAVTIDVIRQVLQNFGMSVENVIYDALTNTISISGPPGEVAEIRRLIDQLDNNAVKRLEQRRLIGESELNIQRAEEERKREEQRSTFEARLIKEILNKQVKIIRLRHASVGATNKTFQGKTFSVPGIGETIEKILGAPTAAISVAAGGQADSRSLAEAVFLTQLSAAARPVISIDQRTNSVIVRGSPKAIEEVEKIVRQLDRPLRMIKIDVIIVKAEKTVVEELGVAYRGSLQVTQGNSVAIDSGTAGTQAGLATAATDAITLLPVAAIGGLDGAFFIRSGQAFLEVQLAALAQDNRIEVIASTSVVTLDNVSASVTRASNVFIRTESSGDSPATLTEIKTGLTLKITPSIAPADMSGETQVVRLSLNATNSTPSAVVGGEVTVSASEIQTEVLIPDGATFVFGGLFDDNRVENHSGIPGLMDIPLLGALFRTDTSQDTLTETVFFIKTSIVDGRKLVGPDIAVRVGTLEYMKRQRSVLHELSREMETGTGRDFPNALQALEEDE